MQDSSSTTVKGKRPLLDDTVDSSNDSSKRARLNNSTPVNLKHPRLDNTVDPWNVLWDLSVWILANVTIKPYPSPLQWWNTDGAGIPTPGTSAP